MAHRLGNCNNDLIDGPAYVNLNNEASNANWNCGVGRAYLFSTCLQCRPCSFTPQAVEIPLSRPYGRDKWKYKPMQTIPFRRSYR